MSKIRFPDLPGLDEDKQKMIANMAEMGKGGKYEVQVKDEETGQTITKALDQLNEKDVANLEKMANTAPKTMEELAKDQLSALDSIAADIKSIADKTGLGIARTKTTGEVLKTSRQISAGITKTLSPKELETKNLAASIDAGIDRNLDILKRLSEGEISKAQAGVELKENLSKLSTFIDTTFKTSISNASVELDKLFRDNPVLNQIKQAVTGDLRGVANIKKVSADADPSNLKKDISNVRNTSTIPTNTTPTTNVSTDKPIEITLNHNIDLKTNGNVDTNQIVMALKNTDVQQGMVGALKEAMFSNGLLAPTANKTQLMNSNLSASSLT